MKTEWKPLTIKVKQLEEKMREGKIQVPTYQRGVVWTKAKQADLIESLKLGYPFGSLIIFNYEENGKPDLLIDGLQRSTALFNFIHNPSETFNVNDVDDETVKKLADMMGDLPDKNGVITSIKKTIVEWVKSFVTSSDVRNIQSYQCAKYLTEQFPLLKSSINSPEELLQIVEEISELINPIFKNYIKLCQDIEEKEIPYIEITGDDSNLSDIFFRINDRGVKLNKQNKFAATWSNSPVTIQKEKLDDLVKLVRDRYEKIMEDGTSIYGYNPQTFLQNKQLDVFELTYAFGKYITKNYPELFINKNDIISVDSIGFTLINACLMGTKDTLADMNKTLLKIFNNDQINEFLIKIISCITYVDELLGPVTKFKGNKRINKSPLHTEFQIVSLISTVFRVKYVTKVNDDYTFNLSNVNNNWNQYDILLRKNALKRYVYDIITGFWSGHGDNSLDTILHSNPTLYTNEVKYADFKSALYNWFSRQLTDRKESLSKEVKSPAEQEKVILGLIYSNTFSAATQLNMEKFDIEHLATKKLMEKRLKKYNGDLKLSISSIGNICLLPEYTNRKKQDDTIYMDKNYIDKLGNIISIDELEEQFTFTKSSELSWIEKDDLSKEEFESCYNDFVTKRFERILEKVMNNLYQ